MKTQRLDEHRILIRHLAALQARCTDTLAERDARIAALEAELMRAHGERIRRDTLLAWQAEALAQARQATPELGARRALAKQVRQLEARVATLSRAADSATYFHHSAPIPSAQHSMPPATLAHRRSFDQDDLEAAMTARDVICQTGCINHGYHWLKAEACALDGNPCHAPADRDKARGTRDADPAVDPTTGERRSNVTT